MIVVIHFVQDDAVVDRHALGIAAHLEARFGVEVLSRSHRPVKWLRQCTHTDRPHLGSPLGPSSEQLLAFCSSRSHSHASRRMYFSLVDVVNPSIEILVPTFSPFHPCSASPPSPGLTPSRCLFGASANASAGDVVPSSGSSRHTFRSRLVSFLESVFPTRAWASRMEDLVDSGSASSSQCPQKHDGRNIWNNVHEDLVREHPSAGLGVCRVNAPARKASRMEQPASLSAAWTATSSVSARRPTPELRRIATDPCRPGHISCSSTPVRPLRGQAKDLTDSTIEELVQIKVTFGRKKSESWTGLRRRIRDHAGRRLNTQASPAFLDLRLAPGVEVARLSSNRWVGRAGSTATSANNLQVAHGRTFSVFDHVGAFLGHARRAAGCVSTASK